MFDTFYKAIICIVFLLDVMLLLFSNGRMSKFLNSVFSIFLFICLVIPVVSLLKPDYAMSVSGLTNSENISIDYDFTNSLQEYIFQNNAKSIEEYASKHLNCKIAVQFNTKIVKEQCVVDNVVVELDNAVITDNAAHINLLEQIMSLVISTFNVKESQVKIYEKN